MIDALREASQAVPPGMALVPIDAAGQIGDAQDITHWMPLPAPPHAAHTGSAAE